MNKTHTISVRILALVNAGADPLDAFREVCGIEVTNNMIETLYVAMREKATRAAHVGHSISTLSPVGQALMERHEAQLHRAS